MGSLDALEDHPINAFEAETRLAKQATQAVPKRHEDPDEQLMSGGADMYKRRKQTVKREGSPDSTESWTEDGGAHSEEDSHSAARHVASPQRYSTSSTSAKHMTRPSSSTSSPSARRRRPKPSATVDYTPSRSRAVNKPASDSTSKPSSSSSPLLAPLHALFSLTATLFSNILFSPFRLVLQSFFTSFLLPLTLTLLALYAAYTLLGSLLLNLRSGLGFGAFGGLSRGVGGLSASTVASAMIPLKAAASIYCTTIGIGCPGSSSTPNGRQEEEKERQQALALAAAREAGTRAEQALDVFQALLSLGEGGEDNGGLYPVEIWELSTAVRYSSLSSRDFLSSQLGDLGDNIRDVKDDVIALNSLGINSMIWVVHEFERLENLIGKSLGIEDGVEDAQGSVEGKKGSKGKGNTGKSGQSASPPPTAAELAQLVDSLFAKINSSLEQLLAALDKTIPRATRASDHSRLIFGALKEVEHESSALAVKSRFDAGWVDLLLSSAPSSAIAGYSKSGWKRQQLERDTRLAQYSADSVVVIWNKLEKTREALVGYRENVGHYKAGVIGYQISSAASGLTMQEEFGALRNVMRDFRDTVDEAKERGRGAGKAGKRREQAQVEQLAA